MREGHGNVRFRGVSGSTAVAQTGFVPLEGRDVN